MSAEKNNHEPQNCFMLKNAQIHKYTIYHNIFSKSIFKLRYVYTKPTVLINLFTIKLWNDLPSHIVDCNEFKNNNRMYFNQ